MNFKVNVGCGQTPTEGFRNIDNSFSVRLSRLPGRGRFLFRLGVISPEQYAFIQAAARHKIEFGDAIKGLSFDDNSCSLVYSSHVLEHVDVHNSETFVREIYRILEPGGVFRLALPDLRLRADEYMNSGNADRFVESLFMDCPRPKGLVSRLKLAMFGSRKHLWMYDGPSASQLLERNGFQGPRVLSAGETTIDDPGSLNLREREDESFYVEARKPNDDLSHQYSLTKP